MASLKGWFLRCDVCGTYSMFVTKEEGVAATENQARKDARKYGWRYPKGKDKCTACVRYDREEI